MKKSLIWVAILMVSAPLHGQTVLTLDDCRQMAVSTSKALSQATTAVEMAGYDRKIAFANYFPSVSATGVYIYNNRDISLVSEEQSRKIRTAGDKMQEGINSAAQIHPDVPEEVLSNPLYQHVLELLQGRIDGMIPNIAEPVNAIGAEIDDALHPDLHNIMAGAVTVRQPIFVGGKIVYSNQMAALAEDLAKAKYDMEYADVLLDTDQAYWQIVSIAGKKKLAESYSALLHQMENDVLLAVREGVATESDALQIKVKANEADMLLTKAANGLVLSKMLLCKKTGLPLDTEIILADESLDVIPVPAAVRERSIEDIWSSRPETRSLTLAGEIFDRKAKVARADMMPKVLAAGGFLLPNPNAYDGIQSIWQGGTLCAGVVVSVPIFHAGESLNKYRKAKAEARLYTDKLEDAKQLISLQVTQQRKLFDEALEKLTMAESNLHSAEENLRKATVGYQAGVVDTNTALGAHTAWLSAHSEYIDAGIELQMAAASLRKAEGETVNNI